MAMLGRVCETRRVLTALFKVLPTRMYPMPCVQKGSTNLASEMFVCDSPVMSKLWIETNKLKVRAVLRKAKYCCSNLLCSHHTLYEFNSYKSALFMLRKFCIAYETFLRTSDAHVRRRQNGVISKWHHTSESKGLVCQWSLCLLPPHLLCSQSLNDIRV